MYKMKRKILTLLLILGAVLISGCVEDQIDQPKQEKVPVVVNGIFGESGIDPLNNCTKTESLDCKQIDIRGLYTPTSNSLKIATYGNDRVKVGYIHIRPTKRFTFENRPFFSGIYKYGGFVWNKTKNNDSFFVADRSSYHFLFHDRIYLPVEFKGNFVQGVKPGTEEFDISSWRVLDLNMSRVEQNCKKILNENAKEIARVYSEDLELNCPRKAPSLMEKPKLTSNDFKNTKLFDIRIMDNDDRILCYYYSGKLGEVRFAYNIHASFLYVYSLFNPITEKVEKISMKTICGEMLG